MCDTTNSANGAHVCFSQERLYQEPFLCPWGQAILQLQKLQQQAAQMSAWQTALHSQHFVSKLTALTSKLWKIARIRYGTALYSSVCKLCIMLHA